MDKYMHIRFCHARGRPNNKSACGLPKKHGSTEIFLELFLDNSYKLFNLSKLTFANKSKLINLNHYKDHPNPHPLDG